MATVPKTPTPQQQQRRDDILDTVRIQLASAGYDGLSMRDVAESAGVSPTTLYNLYDNKDGLILAALQDILAQIGERLAETGVRGAELLILRTGIVGELIVDNPAYAKAMAQMLFNADPADPVSALLLKNQLQVYQEMLKQMKAMGEIAKDADVTAFSRLLVGNSWSGNTLWLKNLIDLEELIEESTTIMLSTIAPVMTPKARKRYRSYFDLAPRPRRRRK